MTTPPGSTSQKTTKLAIPHPYEKDCAIAGVLEQIAPDQPTQGRKIALKKLAYRLPQDSFRFDFRGNHETPGTWAFGRFTNDVLDLEVVVDYLTKEFGYVVDMVVGHSRGSVVGMLWLCKHRDGAAKDATRITRDDYEEFASVDTSVVWDQFPARVDVLTLHGLKDAVVPPYDAVIYARIYGARSPGTHTLRIVEEADHNFTGIPEEVVDTVLEWIQQQDRKELKTEVWHTGVKGKS
ncbi:hypothetical protein TRAPUB_9453 [Trametes pubescens]|uniref:Peptidase S9 prolyl oligopeptidase catalytic domain-containing protein n=1 Tax=Trametes pubescens TaxID=154538 RepID=A0A1M2W283_TRAPU|nr:hypothetical protein TRAPUB_9453 [Trametes pubescens]